MANEFKAVIVEGLRTGLSEYKVRQQIREIVSDFGKELALGISSEMGVNARVAFHDPTQAPSWASLFSTPSAVLVEPESNSLSVSVDNGLRWAEILKIDLNAGHGYPCAIEYDGSRYICTTEEELNARLAKMMQEQGAYIVERVNGLAAKNVMR